MTPDALAILLSVAAWRRYCDAWAGVPPSEREPYEEEKWLRR
jgi:hypothetical protein